MPIIERTEAARQDLVDIGEYIARDNPDAAERVLDAVEDKCRRLLQNPKMGAECAHLGEGLRHFWVSPFQYVLYYRVIDDGIRLIRVLHGRRNIPAIFENEPPAS